MCPCESVLLYPLEKFVVDQQIFLKMPVKILTLLTKCEFLIFLTTTFFTTWMF